MKKKSTAQRGYAIQLCCSYQGKGRLPRDRIAEWMVTGPYRHAN